MSITKARPGPGPLSRILEALAGFLVPAVCLGCGRGLGGERRHLGLCIACCGRLAPPAPGCAVCGEPIPAAAPALGRAQGRPPLPPGWTCGDCRRRPPPFAVLRAAWSYEGPVAAVVRGLKFRRLDYLGGHLARDLRELVPGEGETVDLVVPVPLHWRRRWVRGYNQAERIARPLGRLLGAPCAELLRRRRATRPQTGLARRERLANPRGAFALRAGRIGGRRHLRRLEGARVLLVDDVVTTGATLRAAGEVLRRAGAREVVALAAARTPAAGG